MLLIIELYNYFWLRNSGISLVSNILDNGSNTICKRLDGFIIKYSNCNCHHDENLRLHIDQ
jgi:hypothetical protein